MFKKSLSIITAAVMAAGLLFMSVPQAAFAKTYHLKFAHPYPSMHPQHKAVLVPWAKKIEEATGGRVQIKFFPGGALCKPGQTIDVIEKHIADFGWDICDYSPGRFPLTSVIELPFMIKTAEQGSVALWKTYEKFPAMQKEWSKIHLLALAPHAPGVFATKKKPIRSMADLKGLKLKTASSFTTDALALFGAVPVVQPVTETYTSLERGVVDGVVNPYDGMVIFKLNELLKYFTPANFYTVVFWVGMDKKTYEAMPDDIKKIIDENSGLTLSRIHGQSFDQTYNMFKKVCIKSGMQEVDLPAAEMDKLVSVSSQLRDKWVKDMEAKGLPGKAVLDTALEYLK